MFHASGQKAVVAENIAAGQGRFKYKKSTYLYMMI
jgi:hypothetical protein